MPVISGFMPIQSKYSQKCSPELSVDEGVTERVDGTVQIAQPVGKLVTNDKRSITQQMWPHPHQGYDGVVRCPAQNERPEYERNGPQSLSSPVLRPRLPVPLFTVLRPE